LRKLRSEVIVEKSRSLKPLEERVQQLENNIEETEERISQLTQKIMKLQLMALARKWSACPVSLTSIAIASSPYMKNILRFIRNMRIKGKYLSEGWRNSIRFHPEALIPALARIKILPFLFRQVRYNISLLNNP